MFISDTRVSSNLIKQLQKWFQRQKTAMFIYIGQDKLQPDQTTSETISKRQKTAVFIYDTRISSNLIRQLQTGLERLKTTTLISDTRIRASLPKMAQIYVRFITLSVYYVIRIYSVPDCCQMSHWYGLMCKMPTWKWNYLEVIDCLVQLQIWIM